MQIIGIVGQQGSGKDTAANYIAKRFGFVHISTGDQIREYIVSHELGETTRDVIQDTIAKLRKQKGPAVIVDEILKKYPDQKLVLSGLRHPAEAQKIIDKGGFIIDLEADQTDRYARSKVRNRVGDEIDFKTFAQQEARENGGELQTFNIGKLESMAGEHIKNTGSFRHFYDQIDQVMRARGFQKL